MGSKEKYIQKRKEIVTILEDNSLNSEAKIEKLQILELLANFDVYEAELHAQNSELLEKEHEILKGKDRYEKLFNLAPIAYFELDEKLNIIQYNQAGLRLFTGDRSGFKIRNHFNIYIFKEDLILYLNLIESAKKIGKSDGKIRMKGTDGLIYGHINIASIEKKNRVHYFVSVLDDTVGVKRELLLLRQAKMASMGEMLSMIAHQWKQPISVISMANSGLKYKAEISETIDLKELENTTKIIDRQVEYMNETLDDFKDFFDESRLKKEINVKDCVARAVEFTEATLRNHRIKLDIEYLDGGSFTVLAYPHDICQILMNIINNAKDQFVTKQMEEKIIQLKIYHHEKNIVFAIKDNAGAIPQNIVDFIFDQNFTTKEEELGSGLGLYISKKIVDEHLGGKLWVENRPEENSVVFYLEVPIKPER